MNTIPEDGPAFDAAMQEIDGEMKADNVPIPAREIEGARRFAVRYVPGMVIMGVNQNPLSVKVMDWIAARYGERLSIDPSPGHIVTEIEGDFYRIVPPKFWGSVKFFSDKELRKYDGGGITKPVAYNVLESVVDLTKKMASGLSDAVVRHIHRDFLFGLRTTSFLEANGKNEMIDRARRDLRVSVDHLVAHPIRAEDSKWSSLQAAEKLLKAAIEAHGGNYEYVHELSELWKALSALGVGGNGLIFLPSIQCKPRIRYPEEKCTPRQAFDAHKAFIMLAIEIFRTCSKFERKLSWVESLEVSSSLSNR